MRISDWSSDGCSSDLLLRRAWHNWTEEITMADPALPPGFELESPPKRRTLSIVSKGDRVDPPPPPGFELEPTGEVVAGDTIRSSEERRVGKKCVSKCRSRLSPYT